MEHAAIAVHRNRFVTDREERRLTADIYFPDEATGARPLVVFVYGGAWESGATGQFSRWALDAASAGFVAAEISYRLVDEALFPAQIHDVCEGIEWLRNSDEFAIDPDAVGIVGHSAGAHLALLAAYAGNEFNYDTGIDAAVGISGVYDIRGSNHPKTLALFGGDPAPAELHRASPITHIEQETPPTLLLHGTADSINPASLSEQLATALSEREQAVEYDAVEHAGHVFLHSSYHYPAVRERVFSFLEQEL